MAEPGGTGGTERCPHCGRAFRRLRAHLPHCRAAPGTAGTGQGTGERPGTGKRTATATAGSGTGTGQGAESATTGTGKRPGTATGTATPGTAPGSITGTGTGTGKKPGSGTGKRLGTAPGTGAESAPGTGVGSGTASAKEKTSGTGTGKRPGSATETGKKPGSAPGKKQESVSGKKPGSGSASAKKQGLASAKKSGSGPAAAPGKRSVSAPGRIPVPVPGSAGAGPGRCGGSGGGRAVEAAVQDVARALDLLPEEVEGVPEGLEKGVRVVIAGHRARVLRGKEPGGTEGAAGALPQRGKTAPKSTHTQPRSLGAVGSVPGSSETPKSGLKATKVLPKPAEGSSSPGELVQQEGTDRSAAGDQQGHLGVGVGYKAPVSALHPKGLHLPVREGLGGDSTGTSKGELRDSREQVAGVSLGTGRDPVLALHQPWLHPPKIQPSCSSRASGAGATGLEWFPDLHPDYEGLRIFPGKRLQEDGITVNTPRGSFTEGQRGPLSERPLMEVRLGELHTWISTCDFSPQGLLGAVQKAWNSYYTKYINVRKGGPAGISMLLAGYCLLSYSWNFQHFKRYRWRKYH